MVKELPRPECIFNAHWQFSLWRRKADISFQPPYTVISSLLAPHSQARLFGSNCCGRENPKKCPCGRPSTIFESWRWRRFTRRRFPLDVMHHTSSTLSTSASDGDDNTVIQSENNLPRSAFCCAASCSRRSLPHGARTDLTVTAPVKPSHVCKQAELTYPVCRSFPE